MVEESPIETQNEVPPQSSSPREQAVSNSPFSVIKKIIYAVVAIVCFFGIIQIISQNLFPANKEQSQTNQITPAQTNWKTYKNNRFKYSVQYPSNLKFSETKYSTVFVAKNSNADADEFPFYYVSIIPQEIDEKSEIYNYMPDELVNKFFSMSDKQSFETQSWPYAEYSTFKKLAMIPLFDTNAVVIENTNVLKGDGRINRRILFKKGSSTIIIGSFYKTQQELDLFRRFLETARFN